MILIQYLRSIIFIILMYVMMVIIGLAGVIPAMTKKDGAYWGIKTYCKVVVWLADVICGLKIEQRGTIPTGNVVIASKHQSFFDVILHTYYVNRVNFVMKQELKYAPILGFYAACIGAAPVKRGKKSKAVSQMMKGIEKIKGDETQLVIYPQGTRVPPGEHRPYKVGAAVICQRMERPCVLAATNVGVFWPKRSMLRKPGVAVIDYFETLDPGLELSDFVEKMETKIETRSNELMAEAGFEIKT